MAWLFVVASLAAGGEQLLAKATVGAGKPLALSSPVDVVLTLENPTSAAVPLYAGERVPVTLQFVGERPQARVSCLTTKLVGRAPEAVAPGGSVTLTVRCERFDISALTSRLPPGRWIAKVTKHPATTKAAAIPMEPVEAPFEIGPTSAPSEKEPARLRLGKLEVSIASQYRGSQRVIGGAVREDGRANVSEHESFNVKLRLHAKGKVPDLLFVDLWVRPVKAADGAVNKAKAEAGGSCVSTPPQLFEEWTATAEPRPLWTQAIVTTDGQAWEGKVPAGKPLELWVNVMPYEDVRALREGLLTYVVRIIDGKQKVHWIESPAINHVRSECAAP